MKRELAVLIGLLAVTWLYLDGVAFWLVLVALLVAIAILFRFWEPLKTLKGSIAERSPLLGSDSLGGEIWFTAAVAAALHYWTIPFIAQKWNAPSAWIVCSFAFFIFLVTAFREIPADPPTVGLVTVLGTRVRKVKREGKFRFFPGYPFIYSFIPINVTAQNPDFGKLTVRVTDMVELELDFSVTVTPWWQNPAALIQYVNKGKERGTQDILSDAAMERLRQHFISEEEGPQDFKTALASADEVTVVILREIAGLEYTEQEADRLVHQLRRANGTIPLFSLGIVINRFNIKSIKVLGETARFAEQAPVEKLQRQAEMVELDHVAARIVGLMRPFSEGGPGLTKKEATELVQSERGKVPKHIQQIKLDASDGIESVFVKLLDNLNRKGGGR